VTAKTVQWSSGGRHEHPDIHFEIFYGASDRAAVDNSSARKFGCSTEYDAESAPIMPTLDHGESCNSPAFCISEYPGVGPYVCSEITHSTDSSNIAAIIRSRNPVSLRFGGGNSWRTGNSVGMGMAPFSDACEV
jgi:hypothetical protein